MTCWPPSWGKSVFESFTESEKGLLGYISEALYDKKTLDDKLVDFPLENTRIDYTYQMGRKQGLE